MSQDDTGFTINNAAQDAELEELQRQVENFQEDFQLRQAQEAAAREEGQRKSTGTAAQTVKNTSVFVGNCDPKTSENDLRLFFSGCGTIRRVTILKDKFTQQPKGTCYVEFETEEAMNSAVIKDGQTCHGKPLKVAIKRDNIPASQRGGMGGVQMPMRGGMPMPGGFRGGRGGQAAQMQMAQQQMMAGMMMMMGGGMPFAPFGGAPRGGRGGRGGAPGGRGRPY